MNRDHSKALFERSRRMIPGGVNSPVRAFKAVGGDPLFISRAANARIVDADGNEFIDYVGSWGPLLFGHAPEFVVESVREAAQRGTSYGAPTAAEAELAGLVIELVPSMEMVRFVSSGSEATSAAIRLARGFTGRSRIIKCAGCYHGSVDALLVKAGSGIATLGVPETAGVPASVAAETIVVEYNSVEQLEAAFRQYPDSIAAFIVEPVAGNMGLVAPSDGYLQAVRELTLRHGALLIFDEVISGFRMAAGGAQEYYGVQPDLTCLGKVIGGGLPVGAYGGRKDIMDKLAPTGPVYQAGTLSGNPLAMSAGIAMLREIKRQGPALYAGLDVMGAQLQRGIERILRNASIPAVCSRSGSLFTLFFTPEPVTDYPTARRSDTQAFARFFSTMLEQGIYLPPSQFECWFISAIHTAEDIERTVAAARRALS